MLQTLETDSALSSSFVPVTDITDYLSPSRNITFFSFCWHCDVRLRLQAVLRNCTIDRTRCIHEWLVLRIV